MTIKDLDERTINDFGRLAISTQGETRAQQSDIRKFFGSSKKN